MDARHFVHFFLASLIIFNTQAENTYKPNKTLELINRNALMNGLNSWAINTLKGSVPTPTAPEDYQKLAQVIQLELGMTTPIIVHEFDPIEIQIIDMFFGFTPEISSAPGLIKINRKKLEQQSAAYIFFAFYSELFKLQHNEFATNMAVSYTVWPLAAFGSYRFLQAHSAYCKQHWMMAGFTAAAIAAAVTNCIGYFNQNRLYHEADRFAAHALGCHNCLEEVIATRESWSEKERASRYRWGKFVPISELRAIAQELKRNELVCEDHKQMHEQ